MGTDVGIVVEKKNSKSGTPMLKIGNQWYVSGRCDVSGVNVGHKITFEWNEFGNDPNRPMRGLQSWGFTPDQPTPQEVEAAKAAAAPKGGGKSWGKGGGGGAPKDRELEIDLQCMRFVGQVVGSYIEHGHSCVSTVDELKKTVKGCWDAISFTRALGGSAPAPATPSSGQANATQAGQPQQTPQGGTQTASRQPIVANGSNPRPTGLFGYGHKYKDTPWNVLPADALNFFLHGKNGQPSNAPHDVKQKCADELWYREQEKLRADQVQQQMQDPSQDDWSDDIPF